jgi:hypothetical protein
VLWEQYKDNIWALEVLDELLHLLQEQGKEKGKEEEEREKGKDEEQGTNEGDLDSRASESSSEEEEEDKTWPKDHNDATRYNFAAMPLAIKPQLVDWSISPMSPISSPVLSRVPSSEPRGKTVFSEPWVGEEHFEKTSFYKDLVQVVFIELLSKHTNKSTTFKLDSWMCQNLHTDEQQERFSLKHFPDLAFCQGREFTMWE